MPRTKVGLQGGFLDDRQFVDGLKVVFFIGAFYTAVNFIRDRGTSSGTQHILSLIMYLVSIPGVSSFGAKGFMDSMVGEAESARTERYPGGGAVGEAYALVEDLTPTTPWEQAAAGAEVIDPIVQSTGYEKEKTQKGIKKLGRVRRIPGRARESKLAKFLKRKWRKRAP